MEPIRVIFDVFLAFFPADEICCFGLATAYLAWQRRAAGGTWKVWSHRCLHTHTPPKIAILRCGRACRLHVTFNFNPRHHCTPNQCTIHQTRSERSYKWSRIERVRSQVPTMTYAFLAFIAFIAFLGAAAAAFAAFLAILLSTRERN